MSHHVVDLTNPFESSPLINTNAYSTSSLMSKEDFDSVAECLEKLGLQKNRPIALLHVRDASHDVRSDGVSIYDVNCVNANPASFQMAVDYLNSRGFSIVTIGNHSSSISTLKEVVEYHRSPMRTPLLDFLIGSAAKIYLGTAAGAPTGVALHFRLPALLTNHLIWNSECNAECFSYGRAVYLLKKVYRNDQILSQSEIVGREFPISDVGLTERGVSLGDNTPEEILEGVRELLALGESQEMWDQVRRGAEQREFWKVFDAHTPLGRVCKDDGALISPSFLRANPHWLR